LLIFSSEKLMFQNLSFTFEKIKFFTRGRWAASSSARSRTKGAELSGKAQLGGTIQVI